MMAVAGGATAAYVYTPFQRDGSNYVTVAARTVSRDVCVGVLVALELVSAGQQATVAGSDAAVMRQTLTAAGWTLKQG